MRRQKTSSKLDRARFPASFLRGLKSEFDFSALIAADTVWRRDHVVDHVSHMTDPRTAHHPEIFGCGSAPDDPKQLGSERCFYSRLRIGRLSLLRCILDRSPYGAMHLLPGRVPDHVRRSVLQLAGGEIRVETLRQAGEP